MDSLPLEAFQLICSFCSLHALANLRLVSKSFLARVDGSLTARRITARPAKIVAAKDKHDANACYIRVTLGRVHDPINVVFDNYNQEHNYLEFVQRSPPALVGSSRLFNSPIATPSATSPAPAITPALRDDNNSYDHTLGRLDLNLWEQQLLSQSETTQKPAPPPTAARPRRSSITQASVIRHTEYRMEQELATPGPITPVSQIRPVRNAFSSALGSSSTPSSSLLSTPPNRNILGQNESYMARFARMVLGEAEPTPTGPSAADLAEQARLLFHSVENEALSARKQYKFGLSEGVHYVGDQDFIMRYTMTFGLEKPEERSQGATAETQGQETHEPTHLSFADIINQERPFRLMLHVDYIRVSWKWITCGASPIRVKARQAGVRVAESIVDPMAQEHPLPHLRIGGIYAERFNRLLQEIKKQDASRHIRSELAMLGYDASILPRGFLSINLRSEPVLRWVTGESKHNDQEQQQDPQQVEVLLDEREVAPKASHGDEGLDSDWEDLATPVVAIDSKDKGKAKQADVDETAQQTKELEDKADQAALEETVLEMKNNLGHLTTRQVLEEMLANQGYSRELVWKYGIVRRDLMGAVPEPGRADQLLKKIIASESTK